ncbi:branched-chain amino acid ABC transporter permease, partial [bacterium]|nr:branched-chain amino acid ABC transporter permease [bacterium]
MKSLNKYIPLFFLIIAAGVLPFCVGVKSYWITVFIFVGIYSIVTIGLSLLLGYAGQISLGHGAFFGIGAYASGLLTTLAHWNPWLAMGAALLLT